MFFFRLIKKILARLISFASVHYPDIVVQSVSRKNRGNVLFSYLRLPLLWKQDDKRFSWHSNCWESKEIVRVFNELDFNVDAIEWTDRKFNPQKNYDIFFDVGVNLQRVAPFLNPKALKILHITGSYPFYQRKAELERVAALEARRGMLYSPKRIAGDLDLFERSLRIADIASLIGNEETLNTYPRHYHNKIELVTVSASQLFYVKNNSDYVPARREFLWFNGGGAVHKGLDLVLEAFAKNPEIDLHVVGLLDNEKDFLKIYEKELFGLTNIKYYGKLSPTSDRFIEIARRVFCFIAPSCSEGISSAVVTCLQIGLYPILTKSNGVSLPNGCGFMLKEASVDAIEKAILSAVCMDDGSVASQIKTVQTFALKEFSRENFSNKMRGFLLRAIQDRT